MSLSSSTSYVRYTGNGATSVYSYTFRIDSDADIRVIKITNATPAAVTVLTLTTDYTVSGVGNASGGNVTLGAGSLTSGYKLLLRRKLQLIQETDISNEGTYYASEHEDVFDNLTFIDQQQQYSIDRAVQLPESVDTAAFDPTLPLDVAGSSNKVPVLNSDGTGFALASAWPTLNTIQSAIDAVAITAASAAAAAASASAASTSASAAATSASAAATSATSSASSASAAATSATAAAASAVAATGPGTVTGTRASPTSITAVGGITPTSGIALETIFIQGSGGAVDVTANPQIAAGTVVGQILRLIGRSDTNTVLLENGTGLSLNGNITMGDDDMINFFWDGTSWSEISRRR